jgi:hypothetical protein
MHKSVHALCASLILVLSSHAVFAQVTDTGVYVPPEYATFQPPALGGRYTDHAFGSSVRRLTSALDTQNMDVGGNLIFITDEYSSMSPFNADNSKVLVIHQSYFALYSSDGSYLKALPFEISASSEPRWSRKNSNVLYYHLGNQLKSYNVATDTRSVVRTFSEYSSINSKGESDISLDGDHFVFVGDNRYVFVYEISTKKKGPALDTAGRGFDSVYITPNNNVTITWLQSGTRRYNGIELYDRNMKFRRQVARAGGHMDVTRDTNGDEVLIWTNSGDANPIAGCGNGIVKIRLSDASQSCLLSLDWSLAVNISAPDKAGWALVSTYAPSDPDPQSSGWRPYTNEIIQVKLDGAQARRLLHHRSRPFDSYNYTPRVSVSRDGSCFIYNSNYNLQAIQGYPRDYTDVYMVDMTGGSSGSAVPPPQSPTPSTAASRTEQDGPGTSYTGTWYPNALSGHSAGSAVLAVEAGSQVSFTFSGTGVRWLGYSDEWSGLAKVYLDGQLRETVDTYSSPAQFQKVMFSATGLASGEHNLLIEVLGTAGSQSGGAWVWIDAFEVDAGESAASPPPDSSTASPPSATASASKIEQNAAAVTYAGNWFERSLSGASGGSAVLAMDAGSSATLHFSGTGVRWIGYQDAWSGVARVSVDGGSAVNVDTFAPVDSPQARVYSVSGLNSGEHTLKIEVLQQLGSGSAGAWVWIDAFEIDP